MHDVPETHAILDDQNSRSSIYEKTTPDERRKYDRAIVDRDPPTYRGVFEKYRLAEKGISFTAFYNYARRIRAAAQNYNLAELVTPSQADLNQTLPRLLGDRLIETLLYHEDATPSQIHRLTLAYASAITTAIKAHDARHLFRRPVPSPSEAEGQVAFDSPWRGGVASPVAAAVPAADAAECPNDNRSSPPNESRFAHLSNADLVALYDRVAAQQAPLAGSSIPHSAPSPIPNPEISNSAPLSAPNPENLVNPVPPSSPPIPHSEFHIPHSLRPVPSPPHHLRPSASSEDNSSHPLLPLATMRRIHPRPCPVCKACDIPSTESSCKSCKSCLFPPILPSEKSPDPNLGAIDESPDSHQPGELPKLPLIKQDFPDPDQEREALRLRVRAAYGLTELPRVSHWIDPALIAEYDLSPNAPDDQLSEDELRRRDLRRALIAFGVIKPDAPLPDSS